MMRRACLVLFAAFALVGFRHIERRPPTGMVAGYTFNHADARDIAGQSSAGTVSGATHGGGVYSFDGVNDYIAIDRSPFSSDTVGTISIWVQPETGANHCFSMSDSATNNRLQLLVSPTQINFTIFYTSTVVEMIKGGLSLSGSYHHVAVVQSGSSVTVYLDSAAVSGWSTLTNGAGWFASVVSANNAAIGRRNLVSGTAYYKGQLDDFLIFDRALTATEIRQLYESGRTP